MARIGERGRMIMMMRNNEGINCYWGRGIYCNVVIIMWGARE